MMDASDMVLDDFGGGTMPTSYLPKSKKVLAAFNPIPTGHVGSRPRPVGSYMRLSLTRDTGVIWRSYYYAGGARIAMREDSDEGTEVFYILSDHLGSTSKVVQVDAVQDTVEVTAQQWYTPWGETRSRVRRDAPLWDSIYN
jgi:hypothetical protein